MAKRKIYTEEEKQVAVAIYIDVDRGPKAAEKETGINRKTIASWVSQRDLAKDLDEKRQRAVDAARNAMAFQKEKMAQLFGERAVWCLEIMDQEFTEIVIDQKGGEHVITGRPKSADVKNFMVAAATGADKTLLLNGEATAITESNVKTPDLKGLVAEQKQKNEAVKAGLMAKVLGQG